MGSWLLYGKRTGLVNRKTGKPVFDSTFRALDSKGVRVSKLSNAMAYAEKSDIQAILDRPENQQAIKNGLVQFDIRPAK